MKGRRLADFFRRASGNASIVATPVSPSVSLFRSALVLCLWLAWFSCIPSRAASSTFTQSPPTLRAQVAPPVVYVRVPSRITVLVQLPALKVAPSQVLLYRLSQGIRQPIGQLRATGGSKAGAVYATQLTFNETNAGTILLQVEAQYQQTGPNLTARWNGRLDSNTLTVRVVPSPQQPGQPASPAPVVTNQSGSSTKTILGAAAGAFAGSVLASLVNKHGGSQGGLQSQPPDQNFPQPDQSQPVQQKPTQKPRPLQPQQTDTALRARGLNLKYPAGWNLNQQILQMGGPIALRNFPQYLRGGIIPGGGAEIEITTTPATGASLEDTARDDLGSAGVPQLVDGRAAVRTYYVDDFTPALSYESIAVYVADGEMIYKFFLSFRAGDPRRDKFLASFDSVLATTRFQN